MITTTSEREPTIGALYIANGRRYRITAKRPHVTDPGWDLRAEAAS